MKGRGTSSPRKQSWRLKFDVERTAASARRAISRSEAAGGKHRQNWPSSSLPEPRKLRRTEQDVGCAFVRDASIMGSRRQYHSADRGEVPATAENQIVPHIGATPCKSSRA